MKSEKQIEREMQRAGELCKVFRDFPHRQKLLSIEQALWWVLAEEAAPPVDMIELDLKEK